MRARVQILAAIMLAAPPVQIHAAEAGVSPKELDVPIADRPVLADRYPDRRVRFPNGSIGHADLVFSQQSGFRPLTLDLYLPPKSKVMPAGGWPVVIYIHGGGWRGGHKRQNGAFTDFPGTMAEIAARGFAVAAVDYRLSEEAKSPAAIKDVKAAIAWLRGSSAKFGLNQQKLGIWGGSAGGQLAGLAAMTCGVVALDPEAASGAAQTGSNCVQAAVAWYGVFDFPKMAEQAIPGGNTDYLSANAGPTTYFGCSMPTCPEGQVRAAGAINFVDPKDPPVLLIHGLDDRVVPFKQSVEFRDRLAAASVPVELILIPGVGHSFIGSTPAETRSATLRALNATISFFEREIGMGK